MIIDNFKCNSPSKETHCFLGTDKEITFKPCPYKTHVVVLSVLFVVVLMVTSYTTFKVCQLEYEVKELRSYAEDTNQFYNYLQQLHNEDVSLAFYRFFFGASCLYFVFLRPLILTTNWF